MTMLITGALGVLLSVLTYYTGRTRQHAHFHAFLSSAWAKYAQRVDNGDDPKTAALDEFGVLKLSSWTWADTRRVLDASKQP